MPTDPPAPCAGGPPHCSASVMWRPREEGPAMPTDLPASSAGGPPRCSASVIWRPREAGPAMPTDLPASSAECPPRCSASALRGFAPLAPHKHTTSSHHSRTPCQIRESLRFGPANCGFPIGLPKQGAPKIRHAISVAQGPLKPRQPKPSGPARVFQGNREKDRVILKPPRINILWMDEIRAVLWMDEILHHC